MCWSWLQDGPGVILQNDLSGVSLVRKIPILKRTNSIKMIITSYLSFHIITFIQWANSKQNLQVRFSLLNRYQIAVEEVYFSSDFLEVFQNFFPLIGFFLSTINFHGLKKCLDFGSINLWKKTKIKYFVSISATHSAIIQHQIVYKTPDHRFLTGHVLKVLRLFDCTMRKRRISQICRIVI